MDPLSVAGSISGLLQIGAKVIGYLSDLADAPAVVRDVLDELQAMRIIFGQLNTFVFTFNGRNLPTFVIVDDFVAVLTGCVCTYSEIEGLLGTAGLKEGDDPRLNLWDRAKWVAKEQDLSRTPRKLERYKASLNTLISVSVHLFWPQWCAGRS